MGPCSPLKVWRLDSISYSLAHEIKKRKHRTKSEYSLWPWHRTSLSTTSHFQCYHLRAFQFIMHGVCCSIRRAVSKKKFFQEKRIFNVFIGIACRFFDRCYMSFLSPYSQLQTYSSSGIQYVAIWSHMKLRLLPTRNMDWRRPAVF